MSDATYSADRALFAEQASTSLYESTDGRGTQYALSLARADAEYCTLPDKNDDWGDKDTGDNATEVIVQLRKRKGRTELFIDGFLSKGIVDAKGPSNVYQHTFTWHRGLHEDVETGTRVFSPVVVAVAIEDGQRPLQDVTVSVLRTFYNYGNSVMSSTLLSETRLEPHRVSDARCRICRAPYPLAYPAPPSVIISDNLDNQRRRRRAEVGTAFSGVQAAYSAIHQQVLIQNPVSLSLNPITVVQAAMNNSIVNEYARGVGFVAALQAFIALGGYTALAMGVTLFMPLAGVYGMWGGATWSLAQTTLSVAVMNTMMAQVNNYLNLSPDVPERRTKFTIRELAATLRSLAVMRTPQGEIERNGDNPSLESSQYHKEMVVWEWLKGANVMPMDTSPLRVSKRFAAVLHLRIGVHDASACAPAEEYHEMKCGRDDCHTLGAAAAGTLKDIEELFDAINELKKNLVKGILGDDITWTDRITGILKGKWDEMQKNTKAARTALELATLAKTIIPGVDQMYAIVQESEELIAAVEQDGPVNVPPINAPYTEGVERIKIRGLKNKLAKSLKAWWGRSTNPQDAHRKSELETILKALDTKLFSAFFSPNTEGATLMGELYKALERKRLPKPPKDCTWMRRLPQRAVAASSGQLFTSRASAVNGYADVSTEQAVSRVYSEYHDADQWFGDAMSSSALALRRLAREWEASSSTRIKLVCACKALSKRRLTPEDAIFPLLACETLVLTTPVDVRVAGVLAAPTEHAQRQIRLVVKRAQQECDKSLLEAMGLKHTDEALLASQLFGDLWVDELVALHKLGGKVALVQMLEQASLRAAARLSAAGALLLELLTVRNPSTNIGSFDDVPFSGTDVSLLATQPGRDAGRLVNRVMFHQDYLSIRSLLAPMLRSAARAAVDSARAFEKRVPEHLPHEPVASLFGNRLDGVAAYSRVSAMSELDSVREAAAAAYPSVRLLPSTPTDARELLEAARNRPTPELRLHKMHFRDIVLAMRFRMASLKMTILVDDETATNERSVDNLAEQLAAVDVARLRRSFFVPFGFGDARPAPTLPPCAAPMFGSVPVFGKPLADAFDSILTTQDRVGTATKAFRVRLEPTLDCLKPLPHEREEPDRERAAEEGESVHPNVVQVMHNAEDNVVTVRYVASRVQREPPDQGRASYPEDAAAAAKEHHRNAVTTRMASDVCAIAWNAERVMQAVIAALASADHAADAYDEILLSFVHPGDGGEQSLWHVKPQNPFVIAQKRKHYKRRSRIVAEGLRYMADQHNSLALPLLKKINAFDVRRVRTRLNYDETGRALTALEGRPKEGTDETWTDRSMQRQKLLDSFASPLLLDTMVVNYVAQGMEDLENAPGIITSTGTSRQTIQADADRGRLGIERDLRAMVTYIGLITTYDTRLMELSALLSGLGGAVSTTTDDARTARVHKALVGALGLGMGMLAPLLGEKVRVTCEGIDLEVGDARGVASNLREAFHKCTAVRLSEACLVVNSVLS